MPGANVGQSERGPEQLKSDFTAITIAVPTYRRPSELRVLIPMLQDHAKQLVEKHQDSYTVRILVVDNDPAASAQPICEQYCSPSLIYVNELQPGVAAVRNRAIEESSSSNVLVMIDDDERPQDRWLEALITTWEDTRPALVSGRVVAEYGGQLDPWIAAGEFFRRRNMPTGSEIDVAAAGNVLLDLVQIRDMNLRFDSSLGLRGGEDTLFSRELHRRGGRMIWCAESVIVDKVPTSRMTRRWVLTRAWSHGNAAALTDLALASGKGGRALVRVQRTIGGAARIFAGAGRFGSGLVLGSSRHQARGLRTLMRGAGMISAAAGHIHREYARTNAAEAHASF
jgi:succinoglycan biosynthesis protein ExoM